MIRHPAKYNDNFIPIFAAYVEPGSSVLDPFGGTGKIFNLREYCPDVDIYCVEIEKEWADLHPETIHGDFFKVDLPTSFFDTIITSPTYGNRMADHHNARDGSKRNTYRHSLNRPLDDNNSGKMQWGREYRRFHLDAWCRAFELLRPGGLLIVNVKDHIRKGKQIPVSRFMCLAAYVSGFRWVEGVVIESPGIREGANRNLRVDHENIYVFQKPREL